VLGEHDAERQTHTNIAFLDTCRDNPLARNLARVMGARSVEVSKGLVAVGCGIGTLFLNTTRKRRARWR